MTTLIDIFLIILSIAITVPFLLYNNIGKKLVLFLKILKSKKLDKTTKLNFETSLINIYKVSQHKLFYKNLKYKDLIKIVNYEIFYLNQLLLKNKYVK